MKPHLPGIRPAGWIRPTVPGRDLPLPETRRRRWAIRSIALVALAATVAYLAWRTTSTVALDAWWLSIPLLVLEYHAAVGLALFAFSLWDVDRRPAVADVDLTSRRLAILVPTYNESIEILTPTVAAAVAARLPHETWVLDDGDRPEVEAMARGLGARYLRRPLHDHAKAGNLNHAFGIVDAEFVAILDADHVADPDLFVRTLGYFEDPRIALVQTPQEFYNLESFEHEGGGSPTAGARGGVEDGDSGQRYHEQSLFYRILQPGKNRWDAAFWCGTGAVVRMAALREVGLVATDTITEDIHTTIRLHRRGWKTVYHNEVLARGLAASDADTYQLQRLRWGTGAMQVLRRENPLVVSGLSVPQRLAYAATLLGWFDAWRSLGYLLLPVAVVVTGAVPIRAEPLMFLAAFATTFLLQQLALRVLSRGCHRPVLSILFDLVRMTPNLLATLTLVSRRQVGFAVTPKGRQGAARRPIRVPLLLRAVLALSVAGAAWYGATVVGLTPVTYAIPWAAHAAFGWLVLNAILVVLAISRIRAPAFAAERRASVRFATDAPGHLSGLPVQVVDLSLTGARVEVADDTILPQAGALTFELGGERIGLRVERRTTTPVGRRRAVAGLEFRAGQEAERARLALALFGSPAGSVAMTVSSVAVDAEPVVAASPVAIPAAAVA